MAKQIKSTKTRRGLPRGAKAAIVVGAMGMGAALFGACDTGTNSTSEPKLCECPNGTVHNNFGCECEGEDCTCTHTMYHLNYGIQLEDQTGGTITGAHINNINLALQEYVDYFSSESAIGQKNIKIVIVQSDVVNRNDNVITVGIDKCNDYGVFFGAIFPCMSEIMARVLNTNIRPANGKILNVGEVIARVAQGCLTPVWYNRKMEINVV